MALATLNLILRHPVHMKILKRGLLVESKQKIMPFLVLLAITQAAIIIGSIVGGVKGTQAFQAQAGFLTMLPAYALIG